MTWRSVSLGLAAPKDGHFLGNMCVYEQVALRSKTSAEHVTGINVYGG